MVFYSNDGHEGGFVQHGIAKEVRSKQEMASRWQFPRVNDHQWRIVRPKPVSVRPEELERIKKAGGHIVYRDGLRVHGILHMSRSLVFLHKKGNGTNN
nr:putative protein phosphatase 2c 49 [Quercus suber]